MVIIALLGVLFVVAFPLTSTYTPVRLDGAAAKLVSDIRYAQHLAVTEKVNHGVTFSANPTNQYSVYRGTTATLVKDPFRTTNDFVVSLNAGEYAGVLLTAVNIDGGTRVEFDSQGIPYNSASTALIATGTVTLNLQGSTRTVQVAPYSGRVTR